MQNLASLLETLAFLDRADRIDTLISLSKGFSNPPPEVVPRTEVRKVPGCESQVYLATEHEGLGLKFRFAVDNPQGVSAMALAQILDQNLSGEPLPEVAQIQDDVVYQIFGNELSMGKSLGLIGMVRMVKAQAERALREK